MNPPKVTLPSTAGAPKAYSYVRFSTPEQAQGDSLRRQTAMASEYCTRHALVLDTELTMQDLGVSAYRGKNLDGTGKLGVFLDAVKAGDVPPGAVLLLESLDRLTRQSARKAVAILGDIVDLGIDVVTLNDGKRYSKASFDDIELVIAVLLMSRAHNESKEKGRRVAEAWTAKRTRQAASGELLTHKVPGWIRVTESGRRELIPERAKIVKRIFKMFAEGAGKAKIATTLNKEKIPPFGSARKKGGKHMGWQRSYISKVLSSTTVLGTMTPHTDDSTARTPQAAVESYYPAAIDRELFDRVQALVDTSHKSRPGMATLAIRNVLAGLGKCPHCDGTMVRKGVGKFGVPKLVCAWAKIGGVCRYVSVSLPLIEAALVRAAAAPPPAADVNLGEELKNRDGELEGLAHAIDLLVGEIERGPSKALSARLKAREEQFARLSDEYAALEKQAAESDSKLFKRRVQRYRAAMTAKPFDVGAANVALREMVSKVVVDYDSGDLVLFWRHDGESRIRYDLAAHARREFVDLGPLPK
jgi:DNA invertase Pin-like site-specific DNA recombinase